MPAHVDAKGASAAFCGGVSSAQDGPEMASAGFAVGGISFVLAAVVGAAGVVVWARTWLERVKASAMVKINGKANGLESNIKKQMNLTVDLEVLQKARV